MNKPNNLENCNALLKRYTEEIAEELREVIDCLRSNSIAIHSANYLALDSILDVAANFVEHHTNTQVKDMRQGENVCQILYAIVKAIYVHDVNSGRTLDEVILKDGCRASRVCDLAGNDFLRLAKLFGQC